MLLKLHTCFLFLTLPVLFESSPIDVEPDPKNQKQDEPGESIAKIDEFELELFRKLNSFSLPEEPYLDYFTLWRTFKRQYMKKYSSYEEEQQRFLNFVQNLHTINFHNLRHNLTLETYTMGINSYVDMSTEEIIKQKMGLKLSKLLTDSDNVYNSNRTQFQAPNISDLPEAVDWREKGYVTPVKNQGTCGSCWAFSAVGALEGQHFKKTSKLVSLSEQQLVDCSSAEGNNGCNGGWMDHAFKYVYDNNGLDTEASYPYAGKGQPCQFKNDTIGAMDYGFVDIKKNSEHDLMVAVATVGPLAVAIEATEHFVNYRSGVFNDRRCISGFVNHGVLVVGYGTTEKREDYWIVKNSFGESWGEQGYIRMVRNKNNRCGIASAASYPVV